MAQRQLSSLEKKLQRSYKLFFIIAIICIPVILFLANMLGFFFKEVKSNGELYNFFVKGDELGIFSEKEVTHLYEVKDLAKNGVYTLTITLAILIISLIILHYKSKEQVNKSFLYGSYLTIILFFMLVILVITNFNFLFTNFHRIFFQTNNWLLNENDLLITLFPLSFFLNTTAKIFISIILESIFIIILAQNRSKL